MIFLHQGQKVLVDAAIERQLRMVCGSQNPSIANQHRIVAAAAQNLDPVTQAHDPWSADENRGNAGGLAEGGRELDLRHIRVNLAPVVIAYDVDREHTKAWLPGFDDLGEQNHPGTCREDRHPGGHALANSPTHILGLHQPQDRRAFASRHHQAVDPLELSRSAHRSDFGAESAKNRPMGRPVTLQSQHSAH
jgi:hypothetical protein